MRHASRELVLPLCDSLEEQAALAVMACAAEGIAESNRMKAAGISHWWQLREASALAVSTITGEAMDTEDEKLTSQVDSFGANVVASDAASSEIPFLRARAFHSAAALGHAFAPSAALCLPSAIQALEPGTALPIRIAACKAIAGLSSSLGEGTREALMAQSRAILSALSGLVEEMNEDTVHLGLEALQMAVRAADPKTCEEAITPLTAQLLKVWDANPGDHLVGQDIIEV